MVFCYVRACGMQIGVFLRGFLSMVWCFCSQKVDWSLFSVSHALRFSVHEPRASSFLVSLFSATYFLGSHDYLDIGLIAFFFSFPDTGFELSQNLFLVSVD